MTDRSSQHWYPTAAYLYTLHLDGPALAWEYLRRNASYRRDWLRRRRKPDAAQAWGLRLLEDPGLDARDAHPAWFPDHDGVVQLYPRRRPTTRCAYLRVLAHSWAQATDPRRQAPGACIALARLLRSARTRTRPRRWLGLSLRHTRLRHALCALPHARCEAGCAICRNRGRACGNSPLSPHARRAAGTAYLASARRDPRGSLFARSGRRSVRRGCRRGRLAQRQCIACPRAAAGTPRR